MKSFNGVNTEERASASFEIQHDIDTTAVNNEDDFIEAHIHWMPSTNDAGDVVWFFDYCVAKVNALPIPQTTLAVVGSCEADCQFKHQISPFYDDGTIIRVPVPSGGFGIGDVIIFNIRRTPTDDRDTYPADAIMIKVALHVPVNSNGSRQRYIK
jgi:hypothetical protein